MANSQHVSVSESDADLNLVFNPFITEDSGTYRCEIGVAKVSMVISHSK